MNLKIILSTIQEYWTDINRRFICKVFKLTNQIVKSTEQGISTFSSGTQEVLRVIMKP
jgi:hypothetical protein